MKLNRTLVIFFLLSTILISCNKKNTPTTQAKKRDLIIKEFDGYDADWKEVEALAKKDLGKSIIARVDSILIKALDQENTAQVFKALAYRSKYQNQVEEEATFKILSRFEDQIKASNFPLKQLLHSATAEIYHDYFSNNRWRYKNRTNTSNFETEDLREWSLQKILDRIDEHYQASLTQEEDLLVYPIQNLKDILVSQDKGSREKYFDGTKLRPSLFDFLADRALGFYQVNEGRITTPADEFKIDNHPVFSSTAEFINLKFQTSDTSSNQYKTALLYKKLLKVHKSDENPDALIDIELNRLAYFLDESQNNEKGKLYIAALNKLSDEYANSAMIAEIDFQKAQHYYEIGRKYNEESLDEDERWYIKKSHELCSKYRNGTSFGAEECKYLLKRIEADSYGFKAEKVYLPNTPNLVRLDYKNVDSLYFKIVRIPNELKNELRNYQDVETFVKKIGKSKAQAEWKAKLSNPGDFQEHSTEIKIRSLSSGKYVLVASKDGEFRLSKSEADYAIFSVSELTYINRGSDESLTQHFYILNRKNGKAISKAKVIAYNLEYNYTLRRSKLKKIGDYYSNTLGQVEIPKVGKNYNFRIAVVYNEDTLNLEESFYLYDRRKRNEKAYVNTHYFTDRAIYRPGQTVYYKGITIEKNKNSNSLKTNFSTEATLMNVNGEKLKSNKHQTNNFGSFQGSFVLPASGLNGNYRIAGKHGSVYFSVEEYKRPTFEIKIDTSKATPKINTEVDVKGKVVAYSGASISDAKIQYKVVRRVSLPYWCSWRMPLSSENEKVIKVGTINSQDDGTFIIPFFAEADEKVKSIWSPFYTFEVSIDVTSSSGETQSLTKNIQLGTSSYYLSTNIDELIQLEELKKLRVYAKNIDGQKISRKATVKLYRLKTPRKAVIPSKWDEVDEPILNEKQYRKNFPGYPFEEESAMENFPRDIQLVIEQVNCNTELNLFKDVLPGAYELEVISFDENGAEIKLNQRFTLYNKEAEKPAYPVLSFFEDLKGSGEPGEQAEFLIGSSLKNLRLLYEVEHDGKIISKKWLNISNEQQKISIPIKEEYRGNFHVSFIGVHSNKIIRYSKTVIVPYTNKKLDIELGTFRNKVEPGSKEKWTMTISGKDGDKASAELLAGMYDKSLDKFQRKNWGLNLYFPKRKQFSWSTDNGFSTISSNEINRDYMQNLYPYRYYPTLNWFNFRIDRRYSSRGSRRFLGVNKRRRSRPKFGFSDSGGDDGMVFMSVADSNQEGLYEEVTEESERVEVKSGKLSAQYGDLDKEASSSSNSGITIRSDFRETAFFYPQLRTDKNGKISFEFEMPEALTEWKFRALAHTKDLKVGSFEESIRTQKKLMVTPNAPRFFRENDELIFKILINNLDENFQTGYAKINFFDASTGNRIDIFNGNSADKKFNIAPNKNSTASWRIRIPQGIKAITYRVEVKSDQFSDGEEKVIPVLLDRMLVTESLPLAVRGNQKKDFRFEKLLSNRSPTLTHESFSIEFTPNPIWYAVQALPYITEGADECSEQVFARFYANALAEKIANDNPRIKEVFNLWKNLNSDELTSKLMKNQELKTILIEETPWLQAAKNESEQKKMIALLFDYNKMALEKKTTIKKLKQLQLPNGGWSWYKGMRDSRYITQYIVNGFGHLKKLGVKLEEDQELSQLLSNGINYLDERIKEDYKDVKKYSKLSNDNLGYLQAHYLYTRSFFIKDLPNSTAYNYYLNQADKYWKGRGLYVKGMLGLALHRLKSKSSAPSLIIASLKDNALQSEDLGMYWKDNTPGYYWYNSSIETQALMVELFQEVAKDQSSVEELRIWLLKQKQTQMWSNTKATALACYALLIGNEKALSKENKVSVKLGGTTLKPSNTEAGTGYFKKVYNKSEVQKNLGNISIDKKDDGVAWGAAYWQYYEDLDRITSAETGELLISKVLFKVEVDETGEKMSPIDASAIEVGDKIRVRLRLESKRNLEFVHLKDMRASGFEPINVISRYKYQDGLGYYESTKDASTNFFMDWLTKGVYVFEYDLRATVAGEFSNGISTIQCQYAPEFAAHSKGKRVTIQ